MDKISSLHLNRYPDALCKELIKNFSTYYHVHPECVSASNGSDEMISILLGSFLERGSTVLTLSPDFSMYRFYCDVYEHKNITLKKDDSFRITPEEIIQSANENKVDMILFSNPCNPTSIGMPKQQILKIISSVSSLVVIDEAYMDFFNDSVLSELEYYDNLIILKTCSKAIGSAAIRLGFAVSSVKITRAICAIKSPYNVNSITQLIGSVLFENGEYINQATGRIIKQKEKLYFALQDLKGKYSDIESVYKSDTNFIVVKCKDAKAVWQELLKKSIAVRYTEGLLRITAGSNEEQNGFLTELGKVLDERKQV